MDAIKKIVEFVEGKIGADDFKQALYSESDFKKVLDDSKELPSVSYIPTNTYQYIIEISLSKTSMIQATC